MWPFTRKFGPVTDIPEDCWAVAVAERDGGPLFLRLNSWAWKIRGHPDYGWRLGIAAPIPEGTELPSVNLPGSRYIALEDRAQQILETGHESIHLATITGPTFRELVYHTRDVERARQKLDGICREFQDLSAASIVEEDPSWRVYTSLCGGRKP